MTVQTALFIGSVVMALGSLAIYFHGTDDPEYRHHTQFHSLVPFIAATAYLAMWLGTGVLETESGPLYLARYADWSVTTPILLTGLVLTGLHEHPRHSTYILPIIVLDVIMVATGLLSALAQSDAAKWIWYAWSCAAFAGVLWLLWGPVRAIGERLGGGIEAVYRKNLVFLTVVWLAYPVVFLLGPEGVQAIGLAASVWAILVLDIVAKVVYGFLATARFKALPTSGARD